MAILPSSVSIIIPCYKQAHLLPQAVDSALRQARAAIEVEVIVVDDGSPDDTAQIARSYGDSVRYLRKPNAGLSAARNTGILAARGQWLIFLDADDLLPPDAVEQHLSGAAVDADVGLFYGTYHYVDGAGKTFGPRFDPVLSREPFHELLLGNYFPPHAAMTRRGAFANAGLFDVTLRSLEDWDMWMRLAASGVKFSRTHPVSVPYRQYPGSMSTDRERMRRHGQIVLRSALRYLHPQCPVCRRCLRAGRWGIRNGFIVNTLSDAKAAGSASAAIAALARVFSAALRDPLILAAAPREAVRCLRHLRAPRRLGRRDV